MAISGDYSAPVTVNGFSCRNCTDVDRAKKHIDPADPSGGPFGVNNTDSKADKSIFDTKKVDETVAALQAYGRQDRTRDATNPYDIAAVAQPTGQLVNLFA